MRLRFRNLSWADGDEGEIGCWPESISERSSSVSVESSSVSVSMKPMPGDSALAVLVGGFVGSWFNRQERARTPVRRMTVPRAIFYTYVNIIQERGVKERGSYQATV